MCIIIVCRERERETVNVDRRGSKVVECKAHPEVHVSLSLYVGGVSHVHGRNFVAGLAGAFRADAVELPAVAGRRVAARRFPIVVNKCLLDLVAGDGSGTNWPEWGGMR